MSSVSWQEISFSNWKAGERIGFHVQFLSASKVICVRCRQNMIVGPQPFKNQRCTSCGMQFITPLHPSYTCTTFDPTITEDFKFERPVDIEVFLHNHGSNLASSSASFGFVYFKEKSGSSPLLKRPPKKIRNDLRFLNISWEKALAVLSDSWIRFYDIQNDASSGSQHKLIGEIMLKEVRLEYITEYKGHHSVLALSRDGSSIYIQVGSPILQNWWGECLEYLVQKLNSPRHGNSCDSFNSQTHYNNTISPLSHTPDTLWGMSPKAFLELNQGNRYSLASTFESSEPFCSSVLFSPGKLNRSEIIGCPTNCRSDFLEEETDIDSSLSSSTDSTTSESPIHSDIDEDHSSAFTGRRDSASSHHTNEVELKSFQETESNWDYLLDAFPLPPV